MRIQLDKPTAASDPGRMCLSLDRLARVQPIETGPLAAIARLLGKRRYYEKDVADHLDRGDSRAAVVVSTNPLRVAAYTDELDCVALLAFEDWLIDAYELAVGTRLLTCNTYFDGAGTAPDLERGPNAYPNWANFQPMIANFLTDDAERVAERMAEIDEEEWARCLAMGEMALERLGTRARSGRPFDSRGPAR